MMIYHLINGEDLLFTLGKRYRKANKHFISKNFENVQLVSSHFFSLLLLTTLDYWQVLNTYNHIARQIAETAFFR